MYARKPNHLTGWWCLNCTVCPSISGPGCQLGSGRAQIVTWTRPKPDTKPCRIVIAVATGENSPGNLYPARLTALPLFKSETLVSRILLYYIFSYIQLPFLLSKLCDLRLNLNQWLKSWAVFETEITAITNTKVHVSTRFRVATTQRETRLHPWADVASWA